MSWNLLANKNIFCVSSSKFLLLLVITLLTISCHPAGQRSSSVAVDSITIKLDTVNNGQQKAETIEIDCDTIYKDSGYKIALTKFNVQDEDETKPNSVFTLLKESNGQRVILYKDSIYSKVQEIRFDDFNGDQIKDILIQNISDVRSNSTYYLYLIDTTRDLLKKIRGFQEIKNPNYLPEYDLIDNYVLSGKNWTDFYKIASDTIKNFDTIIYDDPDKSGSYDRDYKKTIKEILESEKKR